MNTLVSRKQHLELRFKAGVILPKEKEELAKMRKVTVEIYGGVASVTSTEKDIEVTIIDHDEKVTYQNLGGFNTKSESI